MWIGSSHDRLEHGVTLDRRSASAGSGHGVYALCGEQFIPLPMLSGPCPALSPLPTSVGRRAFVGRVLSAGDPVYDRFIDQPDPIPTDSRNPVADLDDSVLIRRR